MVDLDGDKTLSQILWDSVGAFHRKLIMTPIRGHALFKLHELNIIWYVNNITLVGYVQVCLYHISFGVDYRRNKTPCDEGRLEDPCSKV